MNLRSLHKTSAIVVAAFACLHLANHLVSLSGVPAHIAFMESARHIYRQPVVETLLLSCVAFQVGSGLWLVLRGWRQRRGAVAWLQALSGFVIAGFLLIHVGAVLYARGVLDLDTNFYFSSAGFHVWPFPLFFVPYYFLAVLALFTHIGCAFFWRMQPASLRARRWVLALPMLVGTVISSLLVLSLAGKIQPVEVPAKYKATYTGFFTSAP
ncbi:hypothetical protein WKW79_16170 [Variovorax robiniae]|uniref:Uncharacterized protein n=1 Tax=Variovorax robiniae TaxID=1836199 RepID=A0ABU8XBU8_9BURK